MGWLLALVAVLLVTAQFATSWAWLSLVGRPGSLPGGLAALWVASWLWLPGYLVDRHSRTPRSASPRGSRRRHYPPATHAGAQHDGLAGAR
jgi:hypothetical protein